MRYKGIPIGPEIVLKPSKVEVRNSKVKKTKWAVYVDGLVLDSFDKRDDAIALYGKALDARHYQNWFLYCMSPSSS